MRWPDDRWLRKCGHRLLFYLLVHLFKSLHARVVEVASILL